MQRPITFDDGRRADTGNEKTQGAEHGAQVEIENNLYVVADGYLIPAGLVKAAEEVLGFKF